MRADTAKDSEHRLNEQRRLHQATIQEMLDIIEVSDVVALEFKGRIGSVAGLEGILDILEAGAENEIARGFEMLPLPIELKGLIAIQEMIQAEVYRPHIERGDLGLELSGRFDALFHPHIRATAGREIDNGIRLLLNAWQEPCERLGSLIGLASLRIPRVQMQNGCAGRCRLQGLLDDFIGRYGEMLRHGRSMDRARNCTRDYSFPCFCHRVAPNRLFDVRSTADVRLTVLVSNCSLF